jgi:hypothetical protein
MTRGWILAVVVAFLGARAEAGPLGRVVGGIQGHVEGKAGTAAPPATPPPAGPRPPVHTPPPAGPHGGIVVVHPGYLYWPPPALALGYYAVAPYPGAYLYDEGPPPAPPPEPWLLELYLGAQSVVDSDHSISVDARLGRGWFGLSAHDTSFFERMMGTEMTTRLDLWSIAFAPRLVQADESSVWLEVGIAGVRTVPDLSLHGASAALRLEHDFTADLALDVLGRVFAFSDDVRALELGLGLRWSIVRLAWRQVDFNTGPPLRGPELGVVLRF